MNFFRLGNTNIPFKIHEKLRTSCDLLEGRHALAAQQGFDLKYRQLKHNFGKTVRSIELHWNTFLYIFCNLSHEGKQMSDKSL